MTVSLSVTGNLPVRGAFQAGLHRPGPRWLCSTSFTHHRKLSTAGRAQAEADDSVLPAYSSDFADAVVRKYVRSNQVIGIGTGPWASCCIETIGRKLTEGTLQGVVCVPASDVAASEAAFHGVPLTALDAVEQVDLAFDEVGVIDVPKNAMVIGTTTEPQQPQILRALELIYAAKEFVAILDSKDQMVSRLIGYLPVVIDEDNWEETAEELDDTFIGDAEIWRRPATGTSNPRGGDVPFVSPEGFTIVDVRFDGTFKLDGEEESYDKIDKEVMQVTGVVAHGMVLGKAHHVVVADGAEPTMLQLL